MPNMQNINRLPKHHEQEAICAPIARAKKQLANGLVE